MTVRFSASVASRLISCPASANLETSIPGWEEPTVDHEAGAKGKGTALHKILQDTSEVSAKDLRFLAQALEYVADVKQQRRFHVMAEATVEADWLQSKPRTTADLVLWTQDELHILDYKTGKILVDPVGNEQLMYYALCFAHLAPKAKGVTLHIIQPWADNMTSWFASTTELAAFRDRAVKAEAEVLAKSTRFGPSDGCLFCPANPQSRGDKGHPLCPAMLQLLYPREVDEAEILGL